jgi:hypothetical protein
MPHSPMFNLSLEGLSSQTSPSFSDPPDFCTLSVSAFRPLQGFRRRRASARHLRSCSGGSSDPCFSLIANARHATLFPSASPIPLRMKFLADPPPPNPHRITFLQKTGEGDHYLHYPQCLPLFSTPSKHPAHSNARNPFPFMGLPHASLGAPGGGYAHPNTLSFRAPQGSLRRPHTVRISSFHFRVLNFLATSLHPYFVPSPFFPWNNSPARTSSQVQR